MLILMALLLLKVLGTTDKFSKKDLNSWLENYCDVKEHATISKDHLRDFTNFELERVS